MSSMYCSLANDAFVEMFTRHYEDEFTCNLEECMLFDVIRKVSTGLTEIGVVTIFSDGEALALRKLEDAGLEFNLILRRPLHAIIGPQNPLYHEERESVTLEELREFPCVINYAFPGDFPASAFGRAAPAATLRCWSVIWAVLYRSSPAPVRSPLIPMMRRHTARFMPPTTANIWR